MKNAFIQKIFILFLISGAFIFASCNKDGNENNLPPTIKPNGLVIKATIDEGTTVKSGVVEGNINYLGESFKWITGDEIYVAFGIKPDSAGKFLSENISGKKADFTNSEELNLASGVYNITGFSPYQSITNLSSVSLSIPQEQTQSAGTSDHIGAYDFMWAKKDNVNITVGGTLESTELSFKHLNPLLRFSFKNVSGTSITIKKIELSTNATNSQFYKAGTVDLTNNNPAINNSTSAEYDTLKLALTGATLASNYDIEQGAVFDAYMMLFPTTGYSEPDDTLSITLTLNNGIHDYKKTLELACDEHSFLTPGFHAGKSYYFKLLINDNGEGAAIPAGTSFQMGSNILEDEKPEHQVTFSKGFRMSKYLVTNAQYASFLNAKKIDNTGQGLITTGGLIKYFGEKWAPDSGFDNYPITHVTWIGVDTYAKWVGGSLPTEAQWECACRAGTSTDYAIGDGGTLTSLIANYLGGLAMTTPVGGPTATPYPANAWGLYDMHGNVAEWCADWYGLYVAGNATDPTGPALGTKRIVRGGHFSSPASACQSASRGSELPIGNLTTGFRVVFND